MEISQDYIQSLLESNLSNPAYQKGSSNWVLSALNTSPHKLLKEIIKHCSISIFCVFILNSTQYLIIEFDQKLKISKLNSIFPFCKFSFLRLKNLPLIQLFLKNNENLVKMNKIYECFIDEVDINEMHSRSEDKIVKRLKMESGTDENLVIGDGAIGANGTKMFNSVAALGENWDRSAGLTRVLNFARVNGAGFKDNT